MKIFLCIVGSLCASIVSAQQPTPSPTKPISQHSCCNHRLVKRQGRATITITSSATPPAPDFFIGEAKVDVTKDETVVRLAMAQHGSVLIELPANDGPRYIIPGDPEMATVDEKALEKNKRAIVVRPGALFLAPPVNRRAHSPAATVTVQMRSGLVVTFLFYPVEDLAQNVHRCVLSYNRDEVVARRRAAGLPVNLDISNNSPERRDETGQSAAPISISVEDDNGKPATKETLEKSSSTSAQIERDLKPNAETEKAGPRPAVGTSESPSIKIETPPGVIQTARDALAETIRKPNRFKKWTRPVHGLTLSVLQQREPKNDLQVLLVAVKNTTSDALKLTSGGPDLIVEMLDSEGKPLNVQSLKKLHSEASESSGAILPKGTVYYAIAYSAPVLGVNQQIKVLVSQTSAADEPASLTLVSGGR